MNLTKQNFSSLNGLELIIKSRKSAVIFEIEQNKINDKYDFWLEFTPEGFNELLEYIETIANKSWANINLREANSLGADYFEYYDRELDSNGYLSIGQNKLIIKRPSLESKKLYQFNKRKMESFIYDFEMAVKRY